MAVIDAAATAAATATAFVCYCPEYEEHAFKHKRCRNCFHPEACHDAGGCRYDGHQGEVGYVTRDSVSYAVDKQPRTPSGNFSLANRKSAISHRSSVAQEILTTERLYVQSLNGLVKLYVRPCRETNVLTQEQQLTLFSNVESIFQLNEELLARLEQHLMQWSETAKLADVFTKLGPMLRLYKVYASNYQSASALLKSLDDNPKWIEFCRLSQGNPTATPSQVTLTVASLLILPIQRVPRYMLLLHDMLKHTDQKHDDYEDLRKAVLLLDEIAAELNTYMHREEETNRVLEIYNSLLGTDVPNLFEAHRKFVKEGDLRKVTSRFETNCHLFVFNDIIVYSHGKLGSYYRYNGTIALGSVWLRSLNDTEKLQNLFQIVAPQKTWTFYAPTHQDKQQWLQDINALVEELVRNDPSLKSKRAADATVKIRGGFWKHISMGQRSLFDAEYAAELKRQSSTGSLTGMAAAILPSRQSSYSRSVSQPAMTTGASRPASASMNPHGDERVGLLSNTNDSADSSGCCGCSIM